MASHQYVYHMDRVSKTFPGGKQVLKDIHLSFLPGAKIGVLGEPLYRIRSCAGLKTTNLAYGEAEGRDLYITEADSGCILRTRLPTPGQVLFSHA